MADARHVVEVIIQAHDRTAEAFQSALQNQKAFTDLQEESARRSEESSRIHERTARTVEELSQKQAKAAQDLKVYSTEATKAAENLETAQRREVAVQNDLNASDIQRKRASDDLLAARTKLFRQLEKENALSAQERRNAVEAVQTLAKLGAARNDLAQITLDSIAREEQAEKDRLRADRARAQEREQIRRRDRQAGIQDQRENQRDATERIRILDEITKKSEEAVRSGSSPQTRREIAQLRQEYVRLGGDASAALKRQVDGIKTARTDIRGLQSDVQNYMRTVQRLRQVEERLGQAQFAGDREAQIALEIDRTALMRDLAQLKPEIEAFLGDLELPVELRTNPAEVAQFEAIKALLSEAINVPVDLNTSKARVEAAALKAKVESEEIEVPVDVDRSRLSQVKGFLSEIGDAAGEGFDKSAAKVAAFDNVLRGLFSLSVFAFFGQIVLGAGAAAGALAALASSAAFAGAALGGALTAGAIQAIPALGVLATAISRVRAVTDAVKQANLLQQQQSGKGADQARQQASAQDAVTAATERVKDATERVTEAREEARRKIEELILAERRATLSAAQARDALRSAVSSGDTGAIASRRLDVQESEFRVRRTREDLATARTEPGVKDAEQQLNQARRAATQAQRSATQASEGLSSSANKLNFLLAGLSAAELRLYRGLQRLQEAWKDFSKTAAEPLINAFSGAVNRVAGILRNPRLIQLARGLSTEMATQFNRAFAFFTSGRTGAQFLRIFEQARGSLRPLVSIVLNLGRALLNIGEASGPSFRRLLGFIERLTDRFADFTDKARKSGDLGKFFQQGITHLIAWIRFLGSIGRLFAAIAGPGGGAEAGLSLLQRMTNAINDFADQVGTKGTKANKFFRDLFTVMKQAGDALGIIFKALAVEITRLFGEEAGSGGASMKAFATIIAQVLIPAFFRFIRMMAGAVTAIGQFLDNNPRIARMVGLFLSFTLLFSILGRLNALLSPITHVLRVIITRLINFRAIGMALSQLRFAAAFNPFSIVAGVILLLLQRFGLLDDVLRGIRTAFTNLFRAARPGFDQFRKAVKELVDALGARSGLVGILRGPMTIAVRVLLIYLEEMGKIAGGMLSGAFRVLGGILRVIARLLRGDFRGALDAVIDIFKGLAQIITAPLRGVARIIARVAGTWVGAFRGALGGLGGVISGIMEGVVGTFRGGVNLLIDGVNFLIRAINAIPNIDVPGIGEVGIPDIDEIGHWGGRRGGGVGGSRGQGAVYRAEGGPIPGQGSTDTVAAMLTPGEHVWTKSEVERAGGHDVIYALRKLFGGGLQSKGGGYAEGGQVRRGRGGDAGEIASKDLGSLIEIIQAGGTRMNAVWRRIWRSIDNTSERSLRSIERDTRRMMGRTADHIENGSRRGLRGLRRSVGAMEDTVYEGMRFIASATNKALKAFDVDPINLSIERPKGGGGGDGKASGGFIGQPGERGRDSHPYWLGRGEAVLNWQHQGIVNSALQSQYGMSLQDMFKRSRSFHAGGPEQPGFARGGIRGTPVDGALPGFIPLMNYFRSRFGRLIYVMSGFRGGSVTTSGNVSNHASGQAVDISHPTVAQATPSNPPKGQGAQQLDRLHAFISRYISSPPRKDFLWRTTTGGNHFNHIHLGMEAALVGNLEKTKAFISKLPEGGMFGDIPKLLVKGKGPIRKLVQNLVDKLRKAATKKIEDSMPTEFGGPGDSDEYATDGAMSQGQVTAVIKKAMDMLGVPEGIRSGWLSMALARSRQESTWNPNAQNNWDINAQNGTPSIGLFQTIGPTFNSNKLPGFNNIRNPLDNTLAAFRYMLGRYGKGSWEQALQVMRGIRGGYAKGGHIPGDDGEPVPILAHAGEWVLNKGQQDKLAALLGRNKDTIKSLLGFTSTAKQSFDEGGEIPERSRLRAIRRGVYELPEFPFESFRTIVREMGRVAIAIRRLDRDNKKFADTYIANLNELTKEGGLFDRLKATSERLTTEAENRLRLSIFRYQRGIGVIRARTEESEARGVVRNLVSGAERLRGTERRIDRREDDVEGELRRVRRAINRITSGGVQKDEKKERDRLVKFYEDLFAARINLRDRSNELDTQIADNLSARFEAAQAALQRTIERSGRRGEDIERALRFAEVQFGAGSGRSFSLMQQQVQAAGEQIKILAGVMKQAQRRGMTDMVREIQGQMSDLFTTILETTLNLIRAQMDAVTQTASRRLAGLDLFDRVLAVREAAGDAAGAQSGRAAVLGARRDALVTQRGGLLGLLQRAQDTGNLDLISDLNAAIGDLNAQITENIQAQKDATTAYRQILIDQISNRAAFDTGARGSLQGILQTVATITGEETTKGQQRLIEGIIASLNTAAGGLREQLLKIFGIDTRGLRGESFVNTMQAILNGSDRFTAGFSTAQKEQFQNLINAIIENEATLQTNTQALNELNGQTKGPQTWSSSSWQFFRNAIFSGMGDVLPQFQSMQTGGWVTKSGLFNLHAGERVINPVATNNNSWAEGDTQITINEAGGPVDVQHLASTLAFHKKTRR